MSPFPNAAPSRIPTLARIERAVHPFTMLAAAGGAWLLAYRVLGQLSATADADTLTRALPGPLAEVVKRFVGAPTLPALFLALVPPLAWIACGGIGSALRADGTRARGAQALVWLGSLATSVAALLAGATAAKQGMSALGYALAWPALASLAAVLWASPLPRLTVVALVTDAVLLGLVARVLPVGWPGENSLSWWPMMLSAPRGPMLLAVGGVLAAAGLAVVAASRRTQARPAIRLGALTLASALLLRSLPALEHYGPDKHAAALASAINTSYFQVASGIRSPHSFVSGYGERMRSLPMHARTHPPSWPLLFRAALDAGAHPAGARIAHAAAWAMGADWRASDTLAASVAERPLAPAETAGLWLMVALLAVCVLALPAAGYFLARAFAPPDVAVVAAAWCALLPAPFLVFPDVDVVHPMLYALAVGAWLRRDRHLAWALAAGVIGAVLVALSLGNLALYLAFASLTLLGYYNAPRRGWREGAAVVLLLLPLAGAAAWAEVLGAHPLALYAEGMRQHHLILAHRTRWLWMFLNPLETAIALGVPTTLWLALHLDLRGLWRGLRRATLAGGERLTSAGLIVLLALDLSRQTRGESGRLWMGFFPLLLAGAAPVLAPRELDWRRLALLLAATLVVLKGFYVFVWLYALH